MSTTSDFASAAQALAAALYAAAVDPADAIRLLGTLADFTPDDVTSSSPIGLATATMQRASGDLFRRAAVVAMARASASYQPASVDDAAAVRATVCAALDAEITIAGDQYEDATYSALRTLRAAVSTDLTERGAGLASVATLASNLPLPALALAHRQYRDQSRSDELVTQADCIHPAFMPTSFKALSK
jgi:prophage DNA circulation protein